MSTLRYILTNILIWLPVLVLDRLSRYAAIAITSEPLYNWGNNISLLFSNNWNKAAFAGLVSPEVAEWLSPAAIVVCMVALLVKCKLHRAPIKSLWFLIPIYLFALSNLADRIVWGMVSDPFTITFGSNLAMHFNLADIGCVVGLILLDISLYKNSQQTRPLHFSLEAAHG